MTDHRIRSRDPQIQAYNDSLARLADTRHCHTPDEVRALRRTFEALSPEQRRTLRYNGAEAIRRTAQERGDQRLVRMIDQGFMPAPMNMGAINIDTGNWATLQERRALGLDNNNSNNNNRR